MINTESLIIWLFNSGLLTAVAIFIIKFLQAHTKNKNVQLFEKWALQAAQLALTVPHNQTNYDRAAELLNDRLKANKLDTHFSGDQVAAAVNGAINQLTEVTA